MIIKFSNTISNAISFLTYSGISSKSWRDVFYWIAIKILDNGIHVVNGDHDVVFYFKNIFLWLLDAPSEYADASIKQVMVINTVPITVFPSDYWCSFQ